MLVDRLRRAYQEIERVQTVAHNFPDDIFVRANLDSLLYDARQLEDDWATQTRLAQQETIRYRMIPQHVTAYTVRSVTKSLLDFQELFAQVYDALQNGAKKQARLAADIVRQTTMNIAFTYPGSLGVAMSMDAQPDLFTGQFDSAVDAFMQTVQAKDEDDVREMARYLGVAVVRKTFDWAKVNLDARYSVDLDWVTASGIHRGGMISIESFNRIVSVISRTSDTERSGLEVKGILVGFDSKKRRFRFVDPDGDDFAGPLSETFPAGQIWPVNDRYVADIEVEQTTEFATDTTRRVYRLKQLNRPLIQLL